MEKQRPKAEPALRVKHNNDLIHIDALAGFGAANRQRAAASPKVVLAEGRLGEYGPGFLRAGFCLPRLVFRPKLQHGQLRGRRQNPGVSTLFSKIIQAGFLRGPLLHAESQESAFRV